MKTFFALALSICTLHSYAQTAPLPESKHKFIVIAHRGQHTEVPENTIASFEEAIKSTVDYVEIDLRTTKDSVLVIMHDATVNRMTNGTGKVSDLTYAEIQKLQITDKTGKTYPIPTFAEVLKTCKNSIHIYLDFKNASVAQSYQMIKKYGMEKQIIVYINEPHQYTEWKALVPEMPLMISLPENIKTADDVNKLLSQTPVALLDGDYSDYTPTTLKAAADAGVPAWPDIQSPDEAKNWDKALATGFKGLQTDHPKALIDYLVKKGLR
jgi:glycerophosphoryl diester phosphodiesterase